MRLIVVSICCFLIFNCAGAQVPGTRIVGGNRARPGQFPHQVSFRIANQHTCGGSILNPTTILSAAHCLVPFLNRINQLTVVTGTNKLSSGGNVYRVKSLVYHSQYDSYTSLNDIGIIKLQTPIQYSPTIQPIKLPIWEVADDRKVTVSGWGLTSSANSDLPDDLQYIELTTINRIVCMIKLWFNGPVTSGHVCTLPNGRLPAGACNGDSGGALFGEDGRQYGIVSWGVPGCGTIGKPDVFTSVYHYRAWIQSYMQ